MDFSDSDEFPEVFEAVSDARETLPHNQDSFEYWFGRAKEDYDEFCLAMAALLATGSQISRLKAFCGHPDFWMSLDDAGLLLVETGVLPHEELNGWLATQEAVHEAVALEDQMHDWEVILVVP